MSISSLSHTNASYGTALIVGGVAACLAFRWGTNKKKGGDGSSCCPPDSLPAKGEDLRHIPRGEIVHLPPSGKDGVSQLKVYIVGASSDASSWGKDKPCIVLSPDMAGMDSGLHKKLADDFAERMNAIVILYDPFDGKPFMSIPESDDGCPQQAGLNLFTIRFIAALMLKVSSITKANDWDTRIKPLFVDQLIPYMESKGVPKFAIVGFCYGAWTVFQASQDADVAPHITCGISFHPSVEGVQKAFGKDDIDLCRRCTRPQMVHATKSESDSWKPNGKAHEALQANPNVTEVQFQQAVSTESHGFMTRSDLSNESSRQAIEEGMKLAIEFATKFSE